MECPRYLKSISLDSKSELKIFHHVIKAGFFFRASDSCLIQRFRCLTCKISFSTETTHPCRYQKKRQFNEPLFNLFASGNSQRRLSILSGLNRKTVVRKFHFMGAAANQALLENRHLSGKRIDAFTFDDMETFEHTKLKPLSITIAVEEKTRFILGFRISKMKANGHLAKRSIQKYGVRKDERLKNQDELLGKLKPFINPSGLIKSDSNPYYAKPVKKHFPRCEYQIFPGARGCVTGQGELKALGFDPLFSLNHTAAMLRANINRLFRKTWNTTKKIEALAHHIAIYIFYHNYVLLKRPT